MSATNEQPLEDATAFAHLEVVDDPLSLDRTCGRLADILLTTPARDRGRHVNKLAMTTVTWPAPARLGLYDGLIRELRGRRSADPEDIGWPRLLVKTANLHWRDYATAAAMALVDEVSEVVRAQPQEGSQLARVAAESSVLRMSIMSTTKGKGAWGDAEADQALAEADAATAWIERLPHPPDNLVTLHIRLAVGAAELWRARHKMSGVGWLTAAAKQHEMVFRAIAWIAGTSDPDDALDSLDRCFSVLPPGAHATFRRLLQILINAARLLTRSQTVDRCVTALRAHTPRGRQSIELSFEVANTVGDLRELLRITESIAREIHGGAMAGEKIHLRRGINKRFGTLANRVRRSLWRNDSDFLAFYWTWQTHRVAEVLGVADTPADDESPAVVAETTPPTAQPSIDTALLERPDPGPADGHVERTRTAIRSLRSAIKAENVIAAAVSLRGLAFISESDWATGGETAKAVLDAVRIWCAELDQYSSPDVDQPTVPTTCPEWTALDEFRVACLLLADRLAARFSPEHRPQILLNLAQLSALPAPDRLACALASVAAARASVLMDA
ncbi:hypothetical protein [Kutzneria sp. 744]|uniref:hypothetical protein n=1 Tax=Kutzneria sp. (strain 744) TaxID=345341 RepID=UPI0003EEBD95|nr:hypothetical protein [Kutzneria sp. 744]EWM12215.1 LigA protein [Kutzneria sp. 744]